MKSLQEINSLANVIKSMVKEARESDSIKKAQSNISNDINEFKNSKIPQKLLKDLINWNVFIIQAGKEVINSEEVKFIVTSFKESDKGKKVIENVDTIEDMIPEKVRIECLNYRHWCMNWFYMIRMGVTAPLPVITGLLQYPWIFDLLKFNRMATAYVEGRYGANVEMIQDTLSYMVRDCCKRIQYFLVHPGEIAYNQNMVPSEILMAMEVHTFVPEFQSCILPKLDQNSGIKYFDASEHKGLAGDTCSMPRYTAGVALEDELPSAQCILTSNLPCDGGLASYETIQAKLGNIPTYHLNVPYNFRDDESQHAFAEDLKNLIKFLEENTGHKMDWDKLREVCNNYNRMVEAELEMWELAKLPNTPISNDALQCTHAWNFNFTSGEKEAAEFQKKILKKATKAYKKGKTSFEKMRYRTIVWAPPPPMYAHWWNWLERCWGIATVMDMETNGAMEYIDTSTPETMLKGLSRRYMWGTMAKHTRGPSKNYLEDVIQASKDFNVDFVILPAHVGCKNSMSMESMLREGLRKINVPLCVFKYELLDNRVASRQQIRDQISKFMTEVMHAEPLDPSLLVIDDGDKW